MGPDRALGCQVGTLGLRASDARVRWRFVHQYGLVTTGRRDNTSARTTKLKRLNDRLRTPETLQGVHD